MLRVGRRPRGTRPGLSIRTASWVVTTALSSLSAIGCGPLVGSLPGPPQAAPPATVREPVEGPSPSPVPASVNLSNPAVVELLPNSPPSPADTDPILGSPWARAPEMEARVQEWIVSFQTREATLFRATLERMGRFRPMVEEELKAQGLPGSLLFLPIVESWYNTRAVSRVGAAGLWQFMPPTARGMGLKVDRLIDERRDPYRATPLALAYLSDMNRQFGSWFLALAAYNGGPGRLSRILGRYGQREMAHDGVFLEVLGALPRETRDFVPRFLAAARIGMDPEAYGFGDLAPEAELRFETVTVPDATSLDVVARAAGVGQETLEALNPQLLRGLTPAGVATQLRVPEGVGEPFSTAYAEIPPEERVTFLEHFVARGETLTHIAQRHGVSVNDLRATNPTIEPRRMQIGQRVVVPKAPSVRGQVRETESSALDLAQERVVVYRVQPGDTLMAIAARHGVGLEDLLRWNSLSRSSVIHPGDQVRVFLAGG